MKIRHWSMLAIATVALRWPLWTLPGPGRDEATYVYWAHRYGEPGAEPSYAPLLQLFLRPTTMLPPDLIWTIRLPSIVFGLAALLLFERWLVLLGLPPNRRGLAVAALALSPWQTYVGSILHPDGLLLCAILLFAIAAHRGRIMLTAIAAAAALWAKPTGLILVATTLLALLGGVALGAREAPRPSRGSRLWAAAVLLGLSAPPLLAVDLPFARALLEFAKLAPGQSWALRLGIGLLGVVVLGGPVLIVALLQGLRESRVGRPLDLPRLTGLLFLFGFAGAACIAGQVKGNWLLPAAPLLWPRRDRVLPSSLSWAGLGLAAALSAAMSLGFRHSDRVKGIEEALGWRVPSYERIAGTREASVSSTHHWWQRMDEYQSLQSLCAKITQLWPGRQAPAWVVSDDYGVAAQWALQCSEAGARLVLPLDPLFAGRSGSPAGMRPDDDVLILCVRARFEELVPDGDSWQELGELAHPVTGASLRVGRLLPRGAGPGHDDTLQRLPGED